MSWTTYGYGYSAGCRSASGGCASGSYQAAAPGQWDCLVRAELYSGRDHRRFRSGLAADRGGVVCAADGVEIDSWMTTLKTQTGGIIPSGFLIIPCPQKNHMHFLC